MNAISSVSILAAAVLLSGCISEDEKKKIEQAGVDLNKLANQIIVTAPAAGATVNTADVIVRVDIPSDVKAKSVTLLVDGVEVGKDDDGAPWEIKWPAYYWGDGNKHSLLLKTVSESGVELRNQATSVTVSPEVNKELKLTSGAASAQYMFGKKTALTFAAVSNAKHYEINIAGKITQTEKPEITLDSLTVGSHEIKYRAVFDNASQQVFTGPYSAVTNVQVQAPYSANQLAITPAKGSLAIKDANSIELNLAAVADANSYEVVSGSKNYVVTDPKVTIDQLAIGSHEVKYRAKFEDDKAGAFTGAFSAPVTVIVSKPDIPTNIKVSANLVDKEYQLDFSWPAMANTQEYEIILEGADKREKPYATNQNKLIIPKVTLGTYEWSIRRKNTAGQWSGKSDKKSVNVGVFRTELGGSLSSRGTRLIHSDSGGYFVLARTNSPEIVSNLQGSDSDWVVKLDNDGNILAQYTEARPGGYRYFDAIQYDDKNLYLVGQDHDSGKGVITKINSELEVQSVKEVLYKPENIDKYIFKKVVDWNGQLVILAEVFGKEGSQEKYFLHKIDYQLNAFQPAQKIPLNGNIEVQNITSIYPRKNGVLSVVGYGLPPKDLRYTILDAGTFLVDLDEQFNKVFEWNNLKTYTHTRAGKVVETSDGKLAIWGEADLGGSGPGVGLSLVNSDNGSALYFKSGLNGTIRPSQMLNGITALDKGVLTFAKNKGKLEIISFDSNLSLTSSTVLDDASLDYGIDIVSNESVAALMYVKDQKIVVRTIPIPI